VEKLSKDNSNSMNGLFNVGPKALFQITMIHESFSTAGLEFEKVINLELPIVGGIPQTVPTETLD
jgi:hypothetical protein